MTMLTNMEASNATSAMAPLATSLLEMSQSFLLHKHRLSKPCRPQKSHFVLTLSDSETHKVLETNAPPLSRS